jgi:tetratricopeptide (TPR) repeat protein
VVALVLLLAAGVQAKFIRPDLEKVPVERLVGNLEGAVEKNPKNAQALYNLARVHAMAFALKTDETEIRKGMEKDGAWFGFTPAFVPFAAQKTDDADKQKAAKAQLAKALARYEQVLKLQPDNLAAQLGHAWAVEQSGTKEEAVKEYRKVIEAGWAKDKDLKNLGLGGHTITAEAAGYLIPLLDKDKDKEEIETLQERIKKLNALPRPITPIAVPLRPGLRARDLEDRSARVVFDADGSGRKQAWSWITPDAGWLVYDPQGRGEVTSALQLFGGVSFWLFWDNGYQALAALDDDGDGELRGKELQGLAIWHDANGDGVCQPGEVRPLSHWGIVALSCSHERDAGHPDRIPWSPRGVRFADGSTRPTWDLTLYPRSRSSR